ncbi:MAG: hypothetical protein M1536_09445 [Firmicutes bacterium]|nr:hypothetical protein [Bacillota bacterium]
MNSLKFQNKGFTLPEILNSMFLVGLLFVVFSIFYIYSSRNSKALNSRFEAQNEASINMKRMVDEISIGNGYAIYGSTDLWIRRDINNTPANFSDDTFLGRENELNQLVYTVIPASGSSYSKVLSSSVDYFNASSSSNTISIELRIKNGDYTFSLYETAAPRSMSLEGPAK